MVWLVYVLVCLLSLYFDRGKAVADARIKHLQALQATPAPEWLRQMQEACSGALEGSSITVPPDALPHLFALMNVGSSMFTGMREQSVTAMQSMAPFMESLDGLSKDPDGSVV